MIGMQLQMKHLNTEEAFWDHYKCTCIEQMKREMYEQEQCVREMKGIDILLVTKTSDPV